VLRRGEGLISRSGSCMAALLDPKFEQDLSKESGLCRTIFEEKIEESAVRTIESKGFSQTSPLPLGYRAQPVTLEPLSRFCLELRSEKLRYRRIRMVPRTKANYSLH
jgi:hypothetical protein